MTHTKTVRTGSGRTLRTRAHAINVNGVAEAAVAGQVQCPSRDAAGRQRNGRHESHSVRPELLRCPGDERLDHTGLGSAQLLLRIRIGEL